MPGDTPSASRVLGGCAVAIACVLAPFAAAALPSTWPLRIAAFLSVTLLSMTVGAWLLPRTLALDEARPATVPPPGPADKVHFVEWEDRHKGCQRPEPHDPHPHYWVSTMPYIVFGVTGQPERMHRPETGSVWCKGVREP